MTREDALVEGTLTAGDLERLRKDFSANPVYRLAQNAVTRVIVDDVAINREIVSRIDHSVSTTLDDWKVTNQEQSGRCGLFAGLNLLRVGVMRKGGLKEFEFSQNYVMFWDKLERANYFLEAVIETADRDATSTTARLPTCWSRRPVTAASGTCSPLWWPSTAWSPRATCRRRRARRTRPG